MTVSGILLNEESFYFSFNGVFFVTFALHGELYSISSSSSSVMISERMLSVAFYSSSNFSSLLSCMPVVLLKGMADGYCVKGELTKEAFLGRDAISANR